jgi:hypothetical protein
MIKPIPQELLDAVTYEDGHLYRDGKKFGTLNKESKTKKRYMILSWRQSMYKVHRIIWLMHNLDHEKVTKTEDGYLFPQIDHKVDEAIIKDNRIENLRLASHAQNMRNRGKMPYNTSGHNGVSFVKSKNCWVAAVSIGGGKRRYKYSPIKGDCPEGKQWAIQQAIALREKYHGEFACHD